jgi:hypothetical protein
MYVSHSECVPVALGIQHAMHMRQIVMWPVKLCDIFPHYPINGTILWGENLLNIKCVFLFSLQLLSETFLILRIIE